MVYEREGDDKGFIWERNEDEFMRGEDMFNPINPDLEKDHINTVSFKSAPTTVKRIVKKELMRQGKDPNLLHVTIREMVDKLELVFTRILLSKQQSKTVEINGKEVDITKTTIFPEVEVPCSDRFFNQVEVTNIEGLDKPLIQMDNKYLEGQLSILVELEQIIKETIGEYNRELNSFDFYNLQEHIHKRRVELLNKKQNIYTKRENNANS